MFYGARFQVLFYEKNKTGFACCCMLLFFQFDMFAAECKLEI